MGAKIIPRVCIKQKFSLAMAVGHSLEDTRTLISYCMPEIVRQKLARSRLTYTIVATVIAYFACFSPM